MKEASVFLQHIVACIDAVESYTKDFTKSLPTTSKNDFPNVPWRKIAAMRDVIVHDYFEIDLDLVWKTARQDLPKLKRELLKKS